MKPCYMCKINESVTGGRCKPCSAEYMRKRRGSAGKKQRTTRAPENRSLITPAARQAITAAAIGDAETIEQFLARGGKINHVPRGATALAC